MVGRKFSAPVGLLYQLMILSHPIAEPWREDQILTFIIRHHVVVMYAQ
jgi:hypothetical protein